MVDPAEEQEALARRRAELSARADERGIDGKSQLEGLPTDDDGLMVAALATLLGVDVRQAFAPEVSVEELERNAERSQAEQEMRYRLAWGYTPQELETLKLKQPETGNAPRAKTGGNDAG